jgi:hypothetical protein
MSNTYPAQINLTSRDYESIRDEVIKKLPIITQGRWSNLNESDPGIAIVELLSAMLDNLYFYQDKALNEIYLPNARQRIPLMKLLRAFGYEMNNITASRGTVRFGIEAGSFPSSYPVTLPKYTQLSAKGLKGEKLIFVTLNDAVITSLSDKVEIPVLQGSIFGGKAQTFTADGQPNQKYLLQNSSLDFSSIVVYGNNNTSDTWTRVDSFFRSGPSDKHFVLSSNDDLFAVVSFGDGTKGAIPSPNLPLSIIAFITNGSIGNVGIGAISSITGSPALDGRGNAVNLVVKNDNPTVGGSDAESIESAKQNAVGQVYTVKKAVTAEDFAILAKSIPNVDKAIAWGEQEENYPSYELLNRVQVCFFSSQFLDFTDTSQKAGYDLLRDSVVRPYLADRMPVTSRMVFVYPKLVDIYIQLLVGIDTNVYNPQLVSSAIKKTLQDTYALANVDFGQSFRISALQKIVNEVEGVAWSQVTRLAKYPVPTFVLDPSQPEIVATDPAPNPPVDVLLGKNELPILVERSTAFSVSVPTSSYVKIDKFPSIYDLNVKNETESTVVYGINDVGSFTLKVVNPDGQSDSVLKGINIIPDTTASHIEISYVSTTTLTNTQTGYYNKPGGDSAVYCPKV